MGGVMGRLNKKWFQGQAFQNAVSNAHAGHAPNDALSLARFGKPASDGGWWGKVERFRNPDYQRMMSPVLDEVRDQGHRSICGFAHRATHKQVADTFDRAAARKREADLRDARSRAMGGVFARKHTTREPHEVITPAMRNAWSDEADRLARENRDVDPAEFDWGQVIRDQVEAEEANQLFVREVFDSGARW